MKRLRRIGTLNPHFRGHLSPLYASFRAAGRTANRQGTGAMFAGLEVDGLWTRNFSFRVVRAPLPRPTGLPQVIRNPCGEIFLG